MPRVRYLSKISGPLLDRIDIHLEVSALNSSEIRSQTPAESSFAIKERIIATRNIQYKRFCDWNFFTNARMTNSHIKQFCKLEDGGERLLTQAIEELGLSARAYYKILKIARTIADLEASPNILSSHLAEAIQYRRLPNQQS